MEQYISQVASVLYHVIGSFGIEYVHFDLDAKLYTCVVRTTSKVTMRGLKNKENENNVAMHIIDEH